MRRIARLPCGRAGAIGLVLLAVASHVSLGAAAGVTPVLTLAVRCASGLRVSSQAPVAVSNLGLIGLEIGMHYFDVPPDQTSPGPLDLILLDDEGRAASAPPNVQIDVVALRGSGRLTVPARFQSSGASGGTEYRDRLPNARVVHAISVWLTVPLDEASRRAGFARFLDELHQSGRSDEARRFEALQNNRMVLDQLAREQQAGQYEVRAHYLPRRTDYWQTELHSTPLRLDIVSKGRWFDSLLTGRPPTDGGCQ